MAIIRKTNDFFSKSQQLYDVKRVQLKRVSGK